MKNVRHFALFTNLVCLALLVPNNTQADKIVTLGGDGLRCYTQTPQVTAAQIATGLAPQGLEAGHASVSLLGIAFTSFQTVTEAVNQYDAIYQAADGALSKTAAGGTKIGYALATTTAPGEVLIAVIG